MDPAAQGMDSDELQEWLDSLDDVVHRHGGEQASRLLELLRQRAHLAGVELPFSANTPYLNTIPVDRQPAYPGSREIERRIKSLVRWNAMAMVVRANREADGIGGHISTYASAATLYEVGFNHFFRGKGDDFTGDHLFIQGHAAPGIYARAFLEGRLSERQLDNFRRELADGGGLPSYPHPRLMHIFWEFPTVSMGLGPLMAIYQARFNRYLADRGLKEEGGRRVWCFVGDGETDEPETLGALHVAARERLDNLTFVVNCNLQRLDGPVRGNGKIIQELEAMFRGAGWNVIKVIWGDDWDPLLAADEGGDLVRRMGEVVDGQYQKYTVESGSYIREHFFGATPALRRLVDHHSDDQLRRLRRGGHDPDKVHAAYRAAVDHRGAPTVILAKTVKGYGLGLAGEGQNVTHQQKKLNEAELREFRARFGIPISDEDVTDAPFYRPADDSTEIRYLQERRAALGGYLPGTPMVPLALSEPDPAVFDEFAAGSGGREVSTTMVLVRLLAKLLKDPAVGRHVVPIIPDEARTFGMEALFRPHGIYASQGQLYDPVDSDTFLYYREARDGQILEEGISEAGAMASFVAAGTSHATNGINMIPFFTFYSMFGFQRVGDLIWAAADARARGFLVGATAGRTTLNGEGLQHQDGHSHLHASAVPTCLAYDPAFAYELAVIVREGIRRMYLDQEDVFYYLTVYNENHDQPAMPEGAEEGILRGVYRVRSAGEGARVQLLGSGSILREVLRAQDLLFERFGVGSDAWSVTSWKALRADGLLADRWSRSHPDQPRRRSFLETVTEGAVGPFVAASDWVSLVPEMVAPWLPDTLVALGTDGFGRSDTRPALRRFFQVDAESIALAALVELGRRGEVPVEVVVRAVDELGIEADGAGPELV